MHARASCGCTDQEQTSKPGRSLLVESRLKIKQLTNQNMLTSLMLRKLLKEDVSKEEFFYQLGRVLTLLGSEYSEIRLLPEPVTVDRASHITACSPFLSEKWI